MEYRLIHPFDMFELLLSKTQYGPLDHANERDDSVTYAYAKGPLEIGKVWKFDGITYIETSFVPAITKDLSKF